MLELKKNKSVTHAYSEYESLWWLLQQKQNLEKGGPCSPGDSLGDWKQRCKKLIETSFSSKLYGWGVYDSRDTRGIKIISH